MSAYLVTGGDPSLVSRALTQLLAELAGSGDLGTEIEEYEPTGEGDEGEAKGRFDLGPVLTALSTPPWLSSHRIVVLREAGALSGAQAGELAKFVIDPVTANVLVLAAAGKTVPQALHKAVKASGGRVVDADPGRTSRAKADWLEAHLRRAPVHLDAAARRRLAEHLGEDAARLDPILEMAEATYGAGSRISPAELEPLLGAEGAAPPWELTDAIDAGDGEEAIRALRRMLGAGGRHPLQVLATLHRHVSGMLRLDGAEDVRSSDDAAAVLSMSSFPARKIMEQGRRLGHDRIARALEVLAGADADLRGRLAWPPELVMEVAVARLAQLSRSTPRPVRRERPAGDRR